jgi:hypothetical protein
MVKKTLIYYLAIAMFIIGIVPRVEAAFVPSQTIAMQAVDRADDLGRIQAVIESKLVKQRLQDLGFTTDEINTRLSQMSDQQIHGFAQQLDDLRVGKDGLGIVIALLIIVILVIVLINLTTGHKVVVTP